MGGILLTVIYVVLGIIALIVFGIWWMFFAKRLKYNGVRVSAWQYANLTDPLLCELDASNRRLAEMINPPIGRARFVRHPEEERAHPVMRYVTPTGHRRISGR